MKDEGMKRLRCRPGDLAFVTKSRVPERIGLLVRVLERCSNGRHDWLVEVQGPGIMAPGAATGVVMLRKRALMRDSNLTPVKGEGRHRQMARQDHAAAQIAPAVGAFPAVL